MPRERWTFEDLEKLRDLAGQGLSPHRISVRLNRSVISLISQARKYGITLRTPSDVRRSYGLAGYGRPGRQGADRARPRICRRMSKQVGLD